MNKVKKLLAVTILLIIVWYILDYSRHGIADLKLVVVGINENTIELAPLNIVGDEVYILEEIYVSNNTTLTSIGFKSIQKRHVKDLKKGDWVRIWLESSNSEKKTAKKIVVINLF
ncbi:hypothetical protein LG307_10645 [Sutcliffiella horikoshii]|uniref:hypothetical protein n=1 Tax=Sutcliffiella horikoshii TaxID=79883 RepID=UPI00384F3C23